MMNGCSASGGRRRKTMKKGGRKSRKVSKKTRKGRKRRGGMDEKEMYQKYKELATDTDPRLQGSTAEKVAEAEAKLAKFVEDNNISDEQKKTFEDQLARDGEATASGT